MALPCHGRITWVQIPYDSFWLCGLKVRTPPFQGGNAVFKSRQSHYDFVAKLVKASDCNSEGVSSTLTEIFSCGKPDAKAYFLDAYET